MKVVSCTKQSRKTIWWVGDLSGESLLRAGTEVVPGPTCHRRRAAQKAVTSEGLDSGRMGCHALGPPGCGGCGPSLCSFPRRRDAMMGPHAPVPAHAVCSYRIVGEKKKFSIFFVVSNLSIHT